MDSPCTRQELGFPFPANQPEGVSEADALRFDAARARDAAFGRFFRRALRRIRDGFAALVTLPRRMAVYDELSALTDRELADIGMARADIRYVFDESFATRVERSHGIRSLVPANANPARIHDDGRLVEAA